MGVCCFITIRLADSIPAELWRAFKLERETWIEDHPEPWDEAMTGDYLHAQAAGRKSAIKNLIMDQRVIVGDRAPTLQRGDHRDVGQLGELTSYFRRQCGR